MIKEIYETKEKQEIAKIVLSDLSEWFGVPEYTQKYIDESGLMPFFAAFANEEPIGFIALKRTSTATAEIYCMGIMKDYQGQNYGRKLYEAFESYAKSHGYKFIQVKTVKFGVYECYDKTNKFYQAMGFSELEVFPTLWDEWNPCQILIKAI